MKLNLTEIRFGNNQSFFVRDKTSDTTIALHTLFAKSPQEREYLLPDVGEVKTVLDIGANIGATAVLLSQVYPEAKVFAFEPVTENFNILKLNTIKNSRIFPFHFGLGRVDKKVPIFKSIDPVNFGGFSLFEKGSLETPEEEIQIRSVETFLLEKDLNQIDVIKIDAEGSENSILGSIPERILRKVKWIEGELHGEKDFETLALLEPFFEIEVTKKFNQRNFNFKALQREIFKEKFNV